MKISIITPTFNDASFLKGNIDSLSGQSYRNFEHVVVDGGSMDGSIEILRSIPNIKWISEQDGGMYDAINKGIRISSGDVLAYLNADDRYFRDTLRTVENVFRRNPQLDFVYGDCMYIDETEIPICTFRAIPYSRTLLKSTRIFWPQPSFFWRKRVTQRVGLFDSSLKLLGDSDFFRRVALSGFIGKHLPKPLSKFMVRRGCISKQFQDLCRYERSVIRERYALSPTDWKGILSECLYYLINIDSYLHYTRKKLLGI